MTARLHKEPDNLVSIACDIGLDAVWRSLPGEYRERYEPVVVILVQPTKGDDNDDETHGIAMRGVDANDPFELTVEMVSAALITAKSVGIEGPEFIRVLQAA